MRILLRSDASVGGGTGHVMRCLTLAEELLARGHDVVLHGALGDVGWLRDHVAAAGVVAVPATPDGLDADRILADGPDAVVVDSYAIPATAISALDARVPVLAIVDGDTRGIRASAYLEQNLGSEARDWPAETAGRMLAGSRYALVRRAVLAQRRTDAWRIEGRPHVIVFMGGSDPHGAVLPVLRLLVPVAADVTAVVAPAWAAEAERIAAARPGIRPVAPTDDLPSLLGRADLVVSAAGTSAWDVCSMGRPAILAAVVDNQRASLAEVVAAGLVRGVDASERLDALDGIGPIVAELLADEAARRRLAERCLEVFDGRGTARVADAVEALTRPAQ